MKRIAVVSFAVAALVALAACSGSGGSSASSSSSVAVSSSSARSTSSAAVLDAGDMVTVPLDYNAGTGYEWQCSVEPEGLVAQVDRVTENQAEGKDIAGGPLQDRFTFRAQKPGEVAITFDLVRSWEGEPSETQVYAFTITDDLKMVLNPYKSDFANEPEWGGNS